VVQRMREKVTGLRGKGAAPSHPAPAVESSH
jgi:hypothetical protein